MDKTPADVLEEAADLLLIHGRCRLVRQDVDGRLCIVGALAKAESGNASSKRTPLTVAAYEALIRTVPCTNAVLWNDDSGRTDDEVRDALLLASEVAPQRRGVVTAPTIQQLRAQAVLVGDLLDQAQDGHDRLLRMLDVLDDAEQSRVEQVAKVRRLADERERLRETTP